MSLDAGTRLGPYEIQSAIGAGGVGEVYRARNTRLDRTVAIRVLPPEFATYAERLTRFEHGLKATAALSHPNVQAVHDVDAHRACHTSSRSCSRASRFRKRLLGGTVPVHEAIGIAVQIAHGLAGAHEKHLVHRDLKPANVFLTTDGAVKILDFGLAKLVTGGPADEMETASVAGVGTTGLGRVLGTMAYIAPEQARGQITDARADVFSLGVVLYELPAGE